MISFCPRPPQLFDVVADPWELHDIASESPAIVTRLAALLVVAMGNQTTDSIDATCKGMQRSLFQTWVYGLSQITPNACLESRICNEQVQTAFHF